MTNNTNDTNITVIKIDPRTPEGRKALRLMVIPTGVFQDSCRAKLF